MRNTTKAQAELEVIVAAIHSIAKGDLNAPLGAVQDPEWQPLVAALREMSENLKLEFQGLLSQNASLRNLVESIPLPLIKWSTRGELLFANRAALSLWGASDREEFLSRRRALDVFARPEELKRLMQEAAETGSISEYEITIKNRNGELRLVSATAAPLREEDKSVTGFVAALREISDQREMEAQLVQMEKLESIRQFAASLAHDFNNILCGILPNLEMLHRHMTQKSKDATATEKELGLLESIDKATQVGVTLSKQLMSFSRKSQSNLAVVNLNSVLRDSLQHLQESLGAGIEIESDLAEDLENIEADKGQLEEVMIHLGKNAQQSMKGTGVLRVSTRNIRLEAGPGARARNLPPGSYVELTVSDSGRGLTPDQLPHVFDPFFDVDGQGQGKGLALSLVYGVVKNHQGCIEVESQPNAGTTFHIFLPVTRKAQVVDTPATPTPRKRMERILVVDDESLVREATTRLLIELGYEVIGVQDGDEALMRFSQGEEYDLVLLDMQMPRLDGQETLSRLRELNPAIRVILTSGHCPPENSSELFERYRCGFLQKPYRLGDISKAVRSALDSRNEERAR